MHCHHVMNNHLIEHEGFFPAPEVDNIHFEARLARFAHEATNDSSEKILAAVASGLFVVVCDSPWLCRATDAVVGSVTYFKSSHTTREEAEQAAEKASDPIDDDRYYVLPRKPLSVRKAAPTDDLIPF